MPVTTFDAPDLPGELGSITTDPPDGMTKEIAAVRLEEVGAELFRLQDLMWGARQTGVLIVLQGRDAAGKDGTIKNVVGELNPRGVSVISFGVPTREEREHDFLWRIHKHTPRRGEVAIFNRSHYEDVLVPRVHKLAGREVWQRRFEQINAFESMLASEDTIVLKFFLHISKKEQLKRLLEREKHPETAWKLNPDDWRDRGLWKQFTNAYEDILRHCSTPQAPWHVVPSDSKWYRNLVVAEALLAAMQPHEKRWREKLLAEGREGKAALAAYRRKLGKLGVKAE